MQVLCRTTLSEAGLLKQLFSKYAAPAVDYIMDGVDAGELVQKVKLTIPVTSLNLITQLCHLLDTLLKDSGHYTDPNVRTCACLLTLLPFQVAVMLILLVQLLPSATVLWTCHNSPAQQQS